MTNHKIITNKILINYRAIRNKTLIDYKHLVIRVTKVRYEGLLSVLQRLVMGLKKVRHGGYKGCYGGYKGIVMGGYKSLLWGSVASLQKGAILPEQQTPVTTIDLLSFCNPDNELL
jgi:hypothetical protein